jgi:FkbM family methyltransferase
MTGLPLAKETSLFKVIRLHAPNFAPAVIFDVGAHIGESVANFARAFPAATIYAFEPVAATFQTLVDNVNGFARVKACNVALGRHAGQAYMTCSRHPATNRILISPTPGELRKATQVSMVAGDEFCQQQGADHIGILKVDAEGHDLDVLIGFRDMLSRSRVDLVEAEVGMSRTNTLHVPFEAVKQFLEPLGYHLFHIYEQVMDTRFSGRPLLRRCNVVFASDAFVEAQGSAGRPAP